MAQSFINRNKKKSSGSLALLLLKLRGRAALLLLVVAVMILFMVPSSLVPDLARVLDVARWGRPSGAMTAAELAAQMRAAQQKSSRSAWSLFSRGGGSNADSLGMVRGGEQDVLGAAAISSKIQGGRTINGVLSPADSRKAGASGVELTDEEARGGLVASAAAAVFPGRNLLTGGRVAPAQEADAAGKMKTDKVPDSAGEKMIAGREGKMSKNEFRQLTTNKVAFEHADHVGGRGSALATLTDARTTGQMSRAPNCTKENSCPPEYAQNGSGSVYDGHRFGKKAGSVIEAAPPVYGVDGASTPGAIMPDKDQDADQMDKIRKDQHDCDVANATYKALLNPHVQRIVELAHQAPTPGNVMESSRECHMVDDLLRQQYNACPLRREDGPYEPQMCD